MPRSDDASLTDGYVASLLTKDALDLSRGGSKRSLLAPKPNTRFLKNILREADGHNAALKRKEQHDARERRHHLEHSRPVSSSRLGHHSSRPSPPTRDTEVAKADRPRKRRRMDVDDRAHETGIGGHAERSRHSRSRSRSRERRHRGKVQEADHARDSHRSYKHATSHRSRSRDSHRSHRSHRHHRDKRKAERRLESPAQSVHQQVRKKHVNERATKSQRGDDIKKASVDSASVSQPRPASPTSSESDPLEELIGPMPSGATVEDKPAVRGRGAAAYSGNIDRHFSESYDPSMDLHPGSSEEKDDWDQALEAIRDRQKWQKIGAQRLREAGFGEQDISKWEKGKGVGASVDGDVDDVRWSKRGEDREWDKGKVSAAGRGTNDPDWGRLKGT
ncbi:MAG: hypothetical protein Q9162_007037 [Coniocarpon cinnabarinum]